MPEELTEKPSGQNGLLTTPGSEISEAWRIISRLITGMRIDDPRYRAARNWLNRNREHQIVSQNVKAETSDQ